MKKLLFLSLLISLTFLNKNIKAQQDSTIQKIIEIGQTDNQTMNHLDVLTNRIGGRPIGSANYETAVVWAAQKFQEWGMDVALHETGTLPMELTVVLGLETSRRKRNNPSFAHHRTPRVQKDLNVTVLIETQN
jgi:hypothetical protein